MYDNTRRHDIFDPDLVKINDIADDAVFVIVKNLAGNAKYAQSLEFDANALSFIKYK